VGASQPFSCALAPGWGGAQPLSAPAAQPWRGAQPFSAPAVQPWRGAQPFSAMAAQPWRGAQPFSAPAAQSWRGAQPSWGARSPSGCGSAEKGGDPHELSWLAAQSGGEARQRWARRREKGSARPVASWATDGCAGGCAEASRGPGESRAAPRSLSPLLPESAAGRHEPGRRGRRGSVPIRIPGRAASPLPFSDEVSGV